MNESGNSETSDCNFYDVYLVFNTLLQTISTISLKNMGYKMEHFQHP